MLKKHILFSMLFILLLPYISYGQSNSNNKLDVFVSILPQIYFVEKIGGDRVETNVLVLPGQSPANYEPTSQQMADLSKSDLLFTIGVPFEKALIPRIKTLMNSLQVININKGIQLREMQHSHDHYNNDHANHDHANKKHDHNGLDPHIWLNPVIMKKASETIYNTLVTLDPKGKEFYTQRYNTLIDDLDQVHKYIKDLLLPVKGSKIFVYHPSYGYFTDEYGILQIALEKGGKSPKTKEMAKFIKNIKENNITHIFVQPQFPRRSADVIANASGAKVIILDPLSKDYINNLKDIAIKIKQATSKTKKLN